MVDFLLLAVMHPLELCLLLLLQSHVIYLDAEVGQVLVDSVCFYLLGLFDQSCQCAKGPFNGFDAHVVVHFFAHQGGFSVGLGLFTDG